MNFFLYLLLILFSYRRVACTIDIVFAMDNTGLWSTSYPEIVSNIIDLLPTFGPDGIRVALIEYAAKPKVLFGFNQYSKKELAKEKVSEIKLNASKGSNITLALEAIETVLNGARTTASKVAIIITDTANKAEMNRAKPISERLKNLGVDLLAVVSRKTMLGYYLKPIMSSTFESKSVTDFRDKENLKNIKEIFCNNNFPVVISGLNSCNNNECKTCGSSPSAAKFYANDNETISVTCEGIRSYKRSAKPVTLTLNITLTDTGSASDKNIKAFLQKVQKGEIQNIDSGCQYKTQLTFKPINVSGNVFIIICELKAGYVEEKITEKVCIFDPEHPYEHPYEHPPSSSSPKTGFLSVFSLSSSIIISITAFNNVYTKIS